MFIIIDYTLVWICRSLIIAAYNWVWQHLLMFFMSLGIPETARTVEAERAQDLAGWPEEVYPQAGTQRIR